MTDERLPCVAVEILLPVAQRDAFADGSDAAGALRERLAAVTNGLIETLGLPCTAAVEIAINDNDDESSLRVRIDGAGASCPAGVLRHIAGLYLDEPERTEDSAAGFADLVAEAEPGQAMAALIAVAGVALRQHPERFVGDEVCSFYRRRVEEVLGERRAAEVEFEDAAVGEVLRDLVAMWLSVGDVESVAIHLADGVECGLSGEKVTESLISALRPSFVELLIDPDYGQQILGADVSSETCFLADTDAGPLLEMLSASLFADLGFRMPIVVVGAVPGAAERAFAFRINDVLGRLWVGPRAEEQAPDLPPAAFVFIAMREEMHTHAWRLFDVDQVEYELGALSATHGSLVATTLESVSSERLTRILREFLRDRIPLRYLPTMLDALCLNEPILGDMGGHIVIDERLILDKRIPRSSRDPADVSVQAIRKKMREFLAFHYSRGTGHINVIQLDQTNIEKAIVDHLASADAEAEGRGFDIERLRAMLAADLSDADEPMAIVATGPVASFLRPRLRDEFPSLPVLAYQDLPPSMRLSVFAMLTFET